MPMSVDQVERCRAIANGIKARGGTPTELALLFLVEHLESAIADAERRAGECDTFMADLHQLLYNTYDTSRGILARITGVYDRFIQARAEREKEVGNEL